MDVELDYLISNIVASLFSSIEQRMMFAGMVKSLFDVNAELFAKSLNRMIGGSLGTDESASIESTKAILRAVLHVVADIDTQSLASLVAHDAELLRSFFFDNDDRVLKFFGHFDFYGRHKLGAKPLDRYITKRRDTLWSSLLWTGKRGVPPSVAAKNPEHMLNLNVENCINVLLIDDMNWWSFDELQKAVSEGGLVEIDRAFFVDALSKKFVATTTSATARTALRNRISELIQRLCSKGHVHRFIERLAPIASEQQLPAMLRGCVDPSSSLPSYSTRLAVFALHCTALPFDDFMRCLILIVHQRTFLKRVVDEGHLERLIQWQKKSSASSSSSLGGSLQTIVEQCAAKIVGTSDAVALNTAIGETVALWLHWHSLSGVGDDAGGAVSKVAIDALLSSPSMLARWSTNASEYALLGDDDDDDDDGARTGKSSFMFDDVESVTSTSWTFVDADSHRFEFANNEMAAQILSHFRCEVLHDRLKNLTTSSSIAASASSTMTTTNNLATSATSSRRSDRRNDHGGHDRKGKHHRSYKRSSRHSDSDGDSDSERERSRRRRHNK